MNPLIINVALTGAVPKKSDYPSLPVNPKEIADDVNRCFAAGARIFHIHMRDKEGNPTQDSDLFEETISLIRAETPEAIVCATTSSRAGNGFQDRAAPLRLTGDAKPDFASLSMGSFNFVDSVSLNPPEQIIELLEIMNTTGIRPELEVFEPGMVNYAKTLISKGLIQGVPVFNILLGSHGSSPADVNSISSFLSSLPINSEWALAGIGRYQKQMITQAIISGGNVRLGMEDAPNVSRDNEWSNLKAVEFATSMARTFDRAIESPEGARARLGLVG